MYDASKEIVFDLLYHHQSIDSFFKEKRFYYDKYSDMKQGECDCSSDSKSPTKCDVVCKQRTHFVEKFAKYLTIPRIKDVTPAYFIQAAPPMPPMMTGQPPMMTGQLPMMTGQLPMNYPPMNYPPMNYSHMTGYPPMMNDQTTIYPPMTGYPHINYSPLTGYPHMMTNSNMYYQQPQMNSQQSRNGQQPMYYQQSQMNSQQSRNGQKPRNSQKPRNGQPPK